MRAVALALALLLVPGLAHGDGAGLLDEAQRKIDDIDYEAARDLVAKAIDAGGLDHDQLARAHRLGGEVAAALDDDPAARDHFLRLLVIDPGATLPEGVSPKINGPFTAARARAKKVGALALDATATRDGDAITVTVDARDPLDQIALVRAEAGDVFVEESGGTLVVPGATASSVVVTALDARRNELATRTVDVAAVVAAVEAPAASGRRAGFPAALRWPTWAGLAVVAGATGGYFTYRVGQAEDELEAINASPDMHTFDDAEAVRDRGRRDALVANVAYGVAGAAAIAAILTLVLEPDGDVEVAPTASPDGAGVAARVRF